MKKKKKLGMIAFRKMPMLDQRANRPSKAVNPEDSKKMLPL